MQVCAHIQTQCGICAKIELSNKSAINGALRYKYISHTQKLANEMSETLHANR